MSVEIDPRIGNCRTKTGRRLRTVLLSSAAAVGLGALIVGSLGFAGGTISFTGPAPAQAAEQSTPPGFADLVAKVKPAVISVRVKIEEQSSAENEDNGAIPRNSPFYRFFFGPNGEQNKQVVTGEGSGF